MSDTSLAAVEREWCRSCGAEVVWAITDRGKSMPVDAEPGTGGSLARRTDLHTSHFATCPQAAGWRKRGRT